MAWLCVGGKGKSRSAVPLDDELALRVAPHAQGMPWHSAGIVPFAVVWIRSRLDWERGREERAVFRAVMRSIVEMYGSDVAGAPAGLEELGVPQRGNER